MDEPFKELAQELNEEFKFTVINVDANGSLAQNYQIRGIPTFLIFKDGNEVNSNDRLIGAMGKEEFKIKLQNAIK